MSGAMPAPEAASISAENQGAPQPARLFSWRQQCERDHVRQAMPGQCAILTALKVSSVMERFDMRSLIVPLILALTSAPALSQDFEFDYRAAPGGSIEVGRISFGIELLDKSAEYGQEELTRLANYMREDLERALVEADWLGVAANETILSVVVVDAIPNRPTLAQVQRARGTLPVSGNGGGATLEASLRAADGQLLATYSYSWFNARVDEGASYGIWTDTRRTFDRFANSIVDSLGDAPMPGI
jgi:hypothetical protein